MIFCRNNSQFVDLDHRGLEIIFYGRTLKLSRALIICQIDGVQTCQKKFIGKIEESDNDR